MIQHNHDQHTDCSPGACPANGTPYESMVPQGDDLAGLRLIAQQDQAQATEEATTREAQSWQMHVDQHRAATAHNEMLALKHANVAEAFDAVADSVRLLSGVIALAIVVRTFRRPR